MLPVVEPSVLADDDRLAVETELAVADVMLDALKA
jgi:hypothetical protein